MSLNAAATLRPFRALPTAFKPSSPRPTVSRGGSKATPPAEPAPPPAAWAMSAPEVAARTFSTALARPPSPFAHRRASSLPRPPPDVRQGGAHACAGAAWHPKSLAWFGIPHLITAWTAEEDKNIKLRRAEIRRMDERSAQRRQAEIMRRLEIDRLRKQRSEPTASPGPAPQPRGPAPSRRPAPLVWQPASGDAAPADARLGATESLAAAAAAWALTAELAASMPAAQHTAAAEEWEWAAAAWHSAHEALEAARQACPESPAVREAEAAVAAARALTAQRRAWRNS